MSESLRLVRLSEVAELNPRLAEELEPDVPVSFVPMSAVPEKGGTATGIERRYSEVSKGYTPFLDGDLLVAKITPCFENGKIAQAALAHRLGFGSTEFHVVRARKERIDARYLLHFLRLERIRREGEGKMTGSAGQRRVPEHFLAALEVPVAPLPEQRRIAAILDQVEALQAKRRETLVKVVSLAEAIFTDLMGDPESNPKGWAIRPVAELVRDIRNGVGRRRKEPAMGTDIVLRLRDIRSDWIDFSNVNRITLTNKEAHRYRVSPGDLLFIRVNGNPDYVGRCAVFEGYDEPVYFNDHIMRVAVDRSIVTGTFLGFVLSSPYGKHMVALHRKTSAGQHTISQEGLGRIAVPVPPLALQEKLSDRITEVRRLKALYQMSLADLETLASSVEDRAFRGEL